MSSYINTDEKNSNNISNKKKKMIGRTRRNYFALCNLHKFYNIFVNTNFCWYTKDYKDVASTKLHKYITKEPDTPAGRSHTAQGGAGGPVLPTAATLWATNPFLSAHTRSASVLTCRRCLLRGSLLAARGREECSGEDETAKCKIFKHCHEHIRLCR